MGKYTIDSLKMLARTSRVLDANRTRTVPGVVVQIAGAQVFCHYLSDAGTGEFDEYHWYVNGMDSGQTFVCRLLDMEANPAMQEHASGIGPSDLEKRYCSPE